jgi:hypothetical protein
MFPRRFGASAMKAHKHFILHSAEVKASIHCVTSKLDRDVQSCASTNGFAALDFGSSIDKFRYLQAWGEYTQMHIAQHDSPIEAFFKL